MAPIVPLPLLPDWFVACHDADHAFATIWLTTSPIVIFVCGTCCQLQSVSIGSEAPDAPTFRIDRDLLFTIARQSRRSRHREAFPLTPEVSNDGN